MAEQTAPTEAAPTQEDRTARARALVAGAKEETSKPAETKVEETKPEVPAADPTIDDDLAAPPKKESKEDKKESRPGTPDKALQKVQQDLAAFARRQEAIEEALLAGDKPSDEDLKKLEERREKAVQSLRDGGFDEAADELAATQSKLGKVDKVEAENQALREKVSNLDETVRWLAEKQKYRNTNVEKVWDSSVEAAEKEAIEEAGDAWTSLTEEQQFKLVKGKATKKYRERCEQVEARHDAMSRGETTKKEEKKPVETATAALTQTSTPSVTGANGEVSEAQRMLERARKLVLPGH